MRWPAGVARSSPRWLAAAVFLLAAAVAPVSALEMPGSDVVRRKLESAIAAELGGTARFERFSVHPLDGSVTFTGLTLAPERGVLHALEIRSCKAEIFVADLLSGDLRIRAVEADGVRVVVRAGTGPRGPEREGPPFDARILSKIERVRIAGGVLEYENRSIPFEVDAAGIAIEGRPEAGRVTGLLTTGRVEFESGAIPRQRFDRARVRVTWQAPRLDFELLEAVGPAGRVTARGRASVAASSIAVAGTLEADLELAEVVQQRAPATRGPVRVAATFRAADPGESTISGTLEGRGTLELEGNAVHDVAAAFRVDRDGVSVTGARATSPDGAVIEDFAFRQPPGGSFTMSARGTADVAGLLRRVKAGRRAEQLRGTARYTLEARRETEGGPIAWTLDARMSADGTGRGAVSGEFHGSGGADGGRVTWLGALDRASVDLAMTWGAAGIEGPWRVTGRLRAAEGEPARTAHLDVLRYLADEGIELPAGTIPYPGGDFSLDVLFEGRGDELLAGDLPFLLARPYFDPRGPTTPIESLEGRVRLAAGGRFAVDFRIAVSGGQGLVGRISGDGDTPVRISAHANGLPLAAAREYLVGAYDLELPDADGAIDGFVDGRDVFDQLDLQFAARIEGSIGGLPPATLHAAGRWIGDTVELPFAALRADGLAAQFRGTVVLPGGVFDWAIRGLLEAEADLSRYALSSGRSDTAGRMVLASDIDFGGTDRPLRARGSFGWDQVVLGGTPIPGGTGEVLPEDGGLLVRLATVGTRIDAHLAGPIGDPALAARIEWTDLALLDLAALLTRTPLAIGLDVRSDGRIDLAGQAFDPATWTGRGHVERLDLFGAILGGRLDEPADFAFEPGGRVVFGSDAPLVLLGARGGRFALTGAANWFGAAAGEIALRVDGSADLDVLEALHPDLVTSGRITGTLDITGPAAAPALNGTAKVQSGRIRFLPYTDAVDELNADLTFKGREVTVSRGSLRIGGGDVTFLGTLLFDGWMPGSVDLRVRGRDVALNIPDGLWGRYDADVHVRGRFTDPEIAGDITMLAGRYTKPFELGAMPGTRVRKIDPATSRAHWTSRVGLRLRLLADDTLSVRNEMTRVQAGFAFDLTGDIGRPLLAGTIVLVEGGRFTFRDIDYEVNAGQVVLDDAGGEPLKIRMRATTDVRGYSVRLDLDAGSEDLDYTLTSVPALSRADILWLLLTGETPEESGSAGGGNQSVSELATSYFGTQIGELLLAGRAKKLLGLDRFQLAPSFVGPSAKPTARVTVGKRIDDKTLAVYSRDLSGETDDVYRLERELTRRVRATLGRDVEGGIGFDLRWLHRFGEEAAQGDGPAGAVPLLEEGRLDGIPDGIRIRIRRDLGLVVGERVPRFLLIEAQEKIRRVLADSGYLSAKVTANLELLPEPAGTKRATVEFDVVPGPRWELRFEGPEKAVTRARQILADLWGGTDFREENLREATRVVRESLAEDGYATAVVDIRKPAEPPHVLEIEIDPGPRVDIERISFEGLSALSPEEVEQQVLQGPSRTQRALGVSGTLFRPRLVEEDAAAIETLYAESGYLETTVDYLQRLSPDGERASIAFVVSEGPLSKVGSVRVEGDWPDHLDPATSHLTLRTGGPFLPRAMRESEAALRQSLDAAGYFTALVSPRAQIEGGAVAVTFRVRPGPRAFVESVRFEGLQATRQKLADRAVKLEPGAPLTSRALRDAESELFRLGVFRRIDITAEPVEGQPDRRVVTIRVEESPKLSLLTSAGYDTEESLRGSVALSNDNLWGLGRTGSLQAYGSGIRTGLRATLEDRYLQGGRTEGLITVGVETEERTGFVLQTTGIGLQLGTPPRKERRWLLRYELEDNRFSDVTLDEESIQEILQVEGLRLEPVRLGGVLTSYDLDRRDSPFVPAKGWIARSEVGYWGPALASERTFAELKGQFAIYVARGRTTLAASTRLGLAWPFADTDAVPLSKRFFAGGSQSLRGFGLDEVGPKDANGNPLGGEALLVTNLEARYRVWSELHAMVFYDVGNVWLKASDFYTGDLRKSAGLGVRYSTPFGALRLEYGWKLDRLEGESPGEFFVSIGEPF